ncbi:hypothetical protein GOP47_0021500 [Adiantum capillus-veneris]|uniref:Epidermal patterning factor-like protein n=1 Tax=Adiantum capillus-veneris TaxID=13818 RepID=A0A9D4U7M6_ADICA|nr:hypothetical protein GOP47_0021500 [Adiantum capillus-veneris]
MKGSSYRWLLLSSLIILVVFSNHTARYQGCCARPSTIILPPSSSAGRYGEGDVDVARGRASTRSDSKVINGSHPNFEVESSGQPLRYLSRGSDKSSQGQKTMFHRRDLIVGALGSTPPKCVKKCSRCTPCDAIRVPIQPGRTKVSIMEYYPEAWKCKCKNKLYMP